MSPGTSAFEVHVPNQYPILQGFLAGNDSAPGDLGNVWRHFCSSQLEVGGYYWHLRVEARDATKTAKVHGIAAHKKTYPAPNVNNVKVERPCSTGKRQKDRETIF